MEDSAGSYMVLELLQVRGEFFIASGKSSSLGTSKKGAKLSKEIQIRPRQLQASDQIYDFLFSSPRLLSDAPILFCPPANVSWTPNTRADQGSLPERFPVSKFQHRQLVHTHTHMHVVRQDTLWSQTEFTGTLVLMMTFETAGSGRANY